MGVIPSILAPFSGLLDTEQVLRDMETLFKAKLNDAIDEINAEKSDFTIPNIDDKAWYFLHLPRVFSYKQWVTWSLEPIEPTDRQSNNMKRTLKVTFEVVKPDAGEKHTENVIWQLLRYTRALEKVSNENADALRGVARLTVENLLPQTILFGGKILRTAGVRIQTSLSAN